MIDFVDLGYKSTQVLMDLSEILLSTSVFEIVTFFLNVLFFLSNKNDSQLWYTILFLIVHIARAIVGLVLTRILPQSSAFLSKMELQGNQ
jgi:hypothetical protein